MADVVDDEGTAFQFYGSWKDYAPIAFTNLLLMIVTLGIYRFWATTRERHYLWSQTRFIDDRLEWTGTGKELFIGFLAALLLFGVPLLLLNFGIQALMLRGAYVIAGILFPFFYVAILYIVGLARFRALRYRLSRTYWHGIRGGSEQGGWAYGWSAIWKPILGSMALGLLIPWSMCELWNERWRAMSFGPHHFASGARPGPLIGRYLLFYLLPIVGCVALVGGLAATMSGGGNINPEQAGKVGLFAIFGILAAYFILGIVAVSFYAAYFREAVDNLSLTRIDFNFTARTTDWFKLFLGDIGLVIVTLGIGMIFLGYRHWKFFITHLEASGEVDLAALTQSSTPMPKQGEGLLDAFDVGAV